MFGAMAYSLEHQYPLHPASAAGFALGASETQNSTTTRIGDGLQKIFLDVKSQMNHPDITKYWYGEHEGD